MGGLYSGQVYGGLADDGGYAALHNVKGPGLFAGRYRKYVCTAFFCPIQADCYVDGAGLVWIGGLGVDFAPGCVGQGCCPFNVAEYRDVKSLAFCCVRALTS